MSDEKLLDEKTLQALKIAFTYMPNPIEVTRYDYADQTEKVLEQVNYVREVLTIHGIDPEEVAGDINPETTPNSCY